MLKKLKRKRKHKNILRISISKSHNRNYWKATRAIRKYKFNCSSVIDNVYGSSIIANHFNEKILIYLTVLDHSHCLIVLRIVTVSDGKKPLEDQN